MLLYGAPYNQDVVKVPGLPGLSPLGINKVSRVLPSPKSITLNSYSLMCVESCLFSCVHLYLPESTRRVQSGKNAGQRACLGCHLCMKAVSIHLCDCIQFAIVYTEVSCPISLSHQHNWIGPWFFAGWTIPWSSIFHIISSTCFRSVRSRHWGGWLFGG